jgi:REP element-mobilizing transposase RayT
MPHSYSNLLIHVVFSTKSRTRSIDPRIQPDLWAYMGGTVREMRGTARLINGIEDHVHMLISLPADISLAECLRVVKTNSSRWIHEAFPDHRSLAWQTGYGAFSVSASNEKQVFKYIQDQERHHRRMTFEKEFISLLRKHAISFDERFLWK